MSAYPADSFAIQVQRADGNHVAPRRQGQQRLARARLRWCISTSYKDWLKVVGSDTAPRDGGCSSHQPIMTCSKRALVRQWVSVSSSSAIPRRADRAAARFGCRRLPAPSPLCCSRGRPSATDNRCRNPVAAPVSAPGGLQDHRHLPQRLAVEQPDRQAQLAGSRL